MQIKHLHVYHFKFQPLKFHSNHSQHTSFSVSLFRIFSLCLKEIFAQFNVSVWKLSEQLQFNLRQLINRWTCVFFVSSLFICWVWFGLVWMQCVGDVAHWHCCLRWWKSYSNFSRAIIFFGILCRRSRDQCAHFRSDYTCIRIVATTLSSICRWYAVRCVNCRVQVVDSVGKLY